MLACITLSFLLCCWDLASKFSRVLIFTKVALIGAASNDVSFNLEEAGSAINTLQSALLWPLIINLILGDTIISWRAILIWDGNKMVRHALVVLMTANAMADIGDGILDDVTVDGPSRVVILDYISSFLSFAVNFLATSMITITAWKYY
ncbi:hypothetical protein GYMLUDRAFT_263707 [Collybiopsis luxurians FD-317 M1]|uniref:Solute carrier family 40 protein n=1 Tax=Collybiopsis luxurians FD-317 M1 TaxID=944289 RepID=A0A0D0BN83_9AGAR|nr:hypothetical protein GYMLUDRAFT_263707 [Collybiopsis luxurians FD-317 M1]